MSSHKHENSQVLKLLTLGDTKVRQLTYLEFLKELKTHSERCLTAPANLLRAIESKGEVDLDELEKTDPELARYRRKLKSIGYPTYNAFEMVYGSQRFVARWKAFLETAAENGQQIFQGMVVIGPPGCGKSMCIDSAQDALEGLSIYAIEGCSTNENPINLLTLLSDEARKGLAAELELGNLLDELMKMAQKPCSHCLALATGANGKMGFRQSADDLPNLASVPVIGTRLSSSGVGISSWMLAANGQSGSLIEAFARGGRGVVNLPECFAAGNPTEQIELLLMEATQNRRIPSAYALNEKEYTPGNYLPLDTCIILQSNQNAWDKFIKGQDDPNRFMGRVFVNHYVHNTSVSEEAAAYRKRIDLRKRVPHIDPLALRLAATLAVASRLTGADQSSRSDDSVMPIDRRMRIYDGEDLPIDRKFVAKQTGGVASYDRTNRPTLNAAEAEKRKPTVVDVWEYHKDEAKSGLDMRFMLAAISQICDYALGNPRHQGISALYLLRFMRELVDGTQKKQLTDEMDKILKSCQRLLKEYSTSDSGVDALIEREYRRMLRDQILKAFEPNFERLAVETFEKYRAHAAAYAQGQEFAEYKLGPEKVKEKVSTSFMADLEKHISFGADEDGTKFRKNLEWSIRDALKCQSESEDGTACGQPGTVDWRTLPKLKAAITKKLNTSVAEKVERILTAEFTDKKTLSDGFKPLNESEQKLRTEAFGRLRTKFGYTCEHCLQEALAYFKQHELWKTINS